MSDHLLRELDDADVIVITVPLYNFSVPATLKAWIDMVCRAGLSFRYTDNGPVGMLRDRPVYLVIASGGVPLGSAADFASGYLHHIFSFIGITDVRDVFAGGTNLDQSASEKAALEMLDQWLPAESAAA
jgi:FMN-dependent NADH-azoreductase